MLQEHHRQRQEKAEVCRHPQAANDMNDKETCHPLAGLKVARLSILTSYGHAPYAMLITGVWL